MSEMKTGQDRLLDAPPTGSGYPVSAPSPSVSAFGGYPSREMIARSLYAVTNHILRAKLWDGWEQQPLEEDPAACEAHYAYADVVLALIANLTNGEWKPISTAPRDGSWLLAYTPDTAREEAVWMLRWLQPNPDEESAFWADDEWRGWQPTHWMPLPLAPGGEARSAETGTGSAEGKHPIGEAEAPINTLLLSALKAMNAALTMQVPGGPDSQEADDLFFSDIQIAWKGLRSAISQAGGR